MLKALHTRLAAVLLVLLLLSGALSIGSTLMTTRLHRVEAEQRMNLDLAAHIVGMKQDQLLTPEGDLDREGLKELFHWLMVVNPRLECYLLDRAGWIVAYDPSLGELERSRVSLGPIRKLSDATVSLPLQGDDPRAAEGGKIFSAARIPTQGDLAGYLYVVLDSRESGSVDSWRTSSILRLFIGAALVFLALAAVACLNLFHRFTRPLRRLAERMRDSPDSGLDALAAESGSPVDEVALLETAFEGMERRLREQISRIEHIETVRRELVAHVSHDLRTPLAALRGYLDTLILKDGDLAPEKRNEYLAIAQRHSERLSKLIAELFELSKLESHEIETRQEPFSVAELVQDNVQRYQIQASQRRLSLTAELEPELPRVTGDLELIERALENLLENALRFTPEGGSVTVKLDPDPVSGRVFVRVSDTGCGIPEEEQPHVFERYYKVTRSRGDAGSGLGLAITKRILDLHGSEVTLESAPGAGTTFSFYLPMDVSGTTVTLS